MSAAGKHSQPYPWEQVEFGHKIYRRTKSEMSSNKLPGVEYEDINSGQGTLNKDITKKSIRKRGIFFQPFDVLFGKLRPYLKNWLYPNFKGVAVGDFWVLYSKLLEPSFIYGMIQTQKFQNVANLSSGSKMPRSDWKLVSRTLFRFPMNKNEQRKIGLLLLNLDKTITLHEEKQRQLELLNKALLQKMFADETGYPILRFKGFSNAWKQRKLGEVSSLRGRIGFRGYKQTDLVEKGKGAITFSPSDIYANGNISFLNNKYISIKKYEESPEIQVNTGDILFTKTASIGKIGYVRKLNEKATINPQIALLTPKLDFNGYFIFLSIRNDAFMRKVLKIVGGSSVPTMSQEKLKNLTINFPSSIEQHKLATIFLKIDNLITLHQHKIDNLKRLKRALLQKMFV